ncbi:MAG: flavodoxin [Clostridia bacterium]|nr:flavodoxin [Clostridia bacterium]
MSTCILLASFHHGNTKLLVDEICKSDEVTVIDVLNVKNYDLSSFDKIGIASGTYGFNVHEEMINFVKENLTQDKNVFIITTSGMGKPFTGVLKTLLKDKNANVIGEFNCGGFCDLKLFKWICGGISKGRPNDMDLVEVKHFYERIKNM